MPASLKLPFYSNCCQALKTKNQPLDLRQSSIRTYLGLQNLSTIMFIYENQTLLYTPKLSPTLRTDVTMS